MPQRLRIQYPSEMYCGRFAATAAWTLAKRLVPSRPDGFPNLTRRFARWVALREDVRARLGASEGQLR